MLARFSQQEESVVLSAVPIRMLNVANAGESC